MSHKALTIAGSDCAGCAGIQADIKTFSAHNVFGMSAITALVSENTLTVDYIMPASVESITSQIDAVMVDMGSDAVKTGMLFSKEIIDAVAGRLKDWNGKLVVDPVMVATTGGVLLQDDAVHSMVKELFPLADVVTPNIPEAELLVGGKITSYNDVKEACRKIARTGPRTVLIKGGHSLGASTGEALDIWYDGKSFYEFKGEWVETKNLHGTGCTFSAAIAANLAHGLILEESLRRAKIYITGAIKAGANLCIGKGAGPVDHFWQTRH